jgi:biotin-(acetyl-CoA carboxylase) ligase
VIGREVTVIKGEYKATAIAQDILASGALLVKYPDGTREELCVGEISLRLTQ